MDKYLTEETALALIVLASAVIVIGMLILSKPIPPKPCSDYADSYMKDVPARCVDYWTNPR